MIRRRIASTLHQSLEDSPVVFLRGPRQTGKTTLVRSLAPGRDYLTLDDAGVMAAAAADPAGFVDGLPQAVTIDEVQRVPALFRAIKAAVDRQRRPGSFLLTGSADVLLVPMAADALVGRMALHTLWPFSQDELLGVEGDFIEAILSARLPSAPDGPVPDLPDLVSRGGYPEAHARSARQRSAWFASYVTTILQRDVRDLARISGLAELPALLTALAARSSQLLSFTDVARDLQLPQTTLKRYVALLEASLLIRPLPAWSANVGKRLAKAPKVLLCDTGLACHQLGADADRLRDDRALLGRLTESFVAAELMKQQTWSHRDVALFHYRTHAQREVDLVVEARDGRLAGVEVKASATVAPADLKGLRDLAEAAGDRFVRGVVLYLGSQVIPFAARLHAVPLQALWRW